MSSLQDPLQRPEQRSNCSGCSHDPPQPPDSQQHPQQHHKHKHTGWQQAQEQGIISIIITILDRQQRQQQAQRYHWQPNPESLLLPRLVLCRQALWGLTTRATTTTRSGSELTEKYLGLNKSFSLQIPRAARESDQVVQQQPDCGTETAIRRVQQRGGDDSQTSKVVFS